MKNLEKLKARLPQFLQRSSQVGEGIESLSKLGALMAPDPETAVTVGAAMAFVGGSIKGLSKLLDGIVGSEESVWTHIEKAERIRTIRHLLFQKIYFEVIFDELERQNDKDRKFKLPPKAFDLLLEDYEAGIEHLTLRQLRNDPEIFDSYRIRLEGFLRFALPTGVNIEELGARLNEEARRRIIGALQNSPDLSNVFSFNTLAKIEETIDFLSQDRAISSHTNKKNSTSIPSLGSIGPSSDPVAQLEAIRKIVLPQGLDYNVQEYEKVSDKIGKQFAEARNELNTGSVAKAKILFEKLVDLLEDTSDVELIKIKARSLSNIGIVLLNYGNFENAYSFFEKAYELFPENENIATLHAFTQFERGDKENALQRLSQLVDQNPQSEGAVTMLAQLIAQFRTPAEAITLLESHPIESENWYDCVARSHFQAEDFLAAEESLKSGLSKYPDSAQLKSALASAIAIPLTKGVILHRAFRPAEQTKRLAEAYELYESALAPLRTKELHHELSEVLLNLASLGFALGKPDESLKYSTEALRIDSENPRALGVHSAAQLSASDHKGGLASARQLFERQPTEEHLLKLVAALMANRRYRDILQVIDDFERGHPGTKANPFIQGHKLEALQRGHRRNDAEDLANHLEQQFPDNEFILGVLADFHSGRNNLEKAETLYLAGIDSHRGKAEEIPLKFGLGDLYYHRREWKKALDCYLSVGDVVKYGPYFANVVHCHLEENNLSKANELISQFTRAESSSSILDLRSHIEFRLSNFQEAAVTLEQLVERAPSKHLNIRLAEAYFRNGDREAAYQIARDLYDEHPQDLELALLASQTSYAVGRNSEGFRFAINAYEKNPHDPRVKRLVLRVVIFDDEQVSLLDSEKEVIRVCLEEDDNVSKIKFERQPDGDVDFQPLLNEIRDHSEAMERFLDEYRENQAPLCVLAEHIGGDMWRAWVAMTSSTTGAIHMASGHNEDQQKQFESALLSFGNGVVVDLSALLTLQGLGLLGQAKSAFGRIIAPSNLITQIQASRDSILAQKKNGGSLIFDQGSFHFIKNNPEETARALGAIDEIISFLQTDFVVTRGLSPQVLEKWQHDESLLRLSDDIFFPIGVALSEGLPLFTDQAALRVVLGHLDGKEGYCSQDFLRALAHRKIIDEDCYEKAVIWLVSHNYNFVSIGVTTIISAFENDGRFAGDLTRKLLDRCAGLSARNTSTTRVLADAAARLWLEKHRRSEDRFELLKLLARSSGIYEEGSGQEVVFLRTLIRRLLLLPACVYGVLDVLGNELEDDRNGVAVWVWYLKSTLLRAIRGPEFRRNPIWEKTFRPWEHQRWIERLLYSIEPQRRPVPKELKRDNVKRGKRIR